VNDLISGVSLITAARERQMQPQAVLAFRERLAYLGADIAGLIDDLQPAPLPASDPAFIDPLAEPEIILLDANCQPMKPDAGRATAFYLPQYRRMYTADVVSASNWAAAVAMGPAGRLFGETDWHLVRVKELEPLICREQHDPATYPVLKPYTPTNDWYWTADPHPSGSSCAFGVYLGGGSVSWVSRNASGLVRLCREVSPRQALAFGK
jgi:hypothetical protein